MFGRLVNGELQKAPRPLVSGRKHIFTNDPAVHKRFGYKQVIFHEQPECPEGCYLLEEWVETGSTIERVWRACAIEAETPENIAEDGEIICNEEEVF